MSVLLKIELPSQKTGISDHTFTRRLAKSTGVGVTDTYLPAENWLFSSLWSKKFRNDWHSTDRRVFWSDTTSNYCNTMICYTRTAVSRWQDQSLISSSLTVDMRCTKTVDIVNRQTESNFFIEEVTRSGRTNDALYQTRDSTLAHHLSQHKIDWQIISRSNKLLRLTSPSNVCSPSEAMGQRRWTGSIYRRPRRQWRNWSGQKFLWFGWTSFRYTLP